MMVLDAVKSGLLPAKGRCVECGTVLNLVRHHHDYSKPLDVVFMCRSCHASLHYRLRSTTQSLHSNNNTALPVVA